MKRTRDTLTGGTMDVSPQLLNCGPLTLSAANTFTELAVILPTNRFQLRKGRSIVIEVLKVYFELAEWDFISAAGGTRAFSRVELSTKSLTAFSVDSQNVFAYAIKNWKGAFSATGSFEDQGVDPHVFDLTDGAGHGFLVATDTIFMGADSGAFFQPGSYHAKILYRFKEVGLEEYIGIVQSQQ